jgi:type I restriction enzyme S subunit
MIAAQPAQVRRVIRFKYGDSLSDAQRIDGDVPVFGSNGPVGTHDRANTKGPVIVIGRKGSFGKVQYSGIPVFAIDTTFFVDETCTSLDLRWVYYALQALELDALSEDVGVPGLSRSKAYQQELTVPSPQRQKAIADYLDHKTARIDALIEEKQRFVDRLVERSAAAIERLIWLRHGDRVAVDRLKHIATRIDVGIAEATTHAFVDAGVPLLRSTNIRANAVDTTDLLYIEPWFADRNASKYIRAGDIVTVRTGNVGVSAVVPSSLDRCQCFTQLITTIDSLNNSRFVCYALNSGPARGHFQTSGWGSAQANISVPILANAPVPIVERDEQERILAQIAALTAPAGKTLQALRRQLVLLVEKRQALTTAAVTGQVRVPGAA